MDENQPSSPTANHASGRPGAPLTRRQLLRAGATAMPVILTLHSGEALARSSNLIGAAPAGTTDAHGNTVCLDTSSVYPLPDKDKYDLGDPAYARFNVIKNRVYYLEANSSGGTVGPDYVCQQGDIYYYKDAGWKQLSLPTNGAIVSTTAVNSVTSSSTNSIVMNYLP